MKLSELKKINLPDNPGVYFFLDPKGKILYIGKATSLKSRVRSYFNKDVIESRGPMIVDMVFRAGDVKFIETDSVLEALLLEANLIRKHTPIYNIKEKDNKSFNYVVVTKEDFPRVLLVRGRNLSQPEQLDFKIDIAYGPFPQGSILKDAMKIVRRIFPYRDKCMPAQGKACFNSQIGLCPGVCTGAISKEDYKKIIHQFKMFFEGRKKDLIKDLEKEMKSLAKAHEFEKADTIKRRLFSLMHIQDVALIKHDVSNKDLFGGNNFRIEAYDVAHQSGKSMVGVMTVVTNGKVDKAEYKKFTIKTVKGANDIASLKEILERRLKHVEWGMPNMIVTDGGIAQKNIAQKVLKEMNLTIPIVSVVKNEAHKPKGILGDGELIKKHQSAILLANNEAHRFSIGFHREKSRKNFLK